MKDLFYAELRNRICEIRSKGFGEEPEMLTQLIDLIERLSNIARKDGLISLEEEVYELEESGAYGFLKQLMMLVVDGTDPEILEEIGTARYFAALSNDYMALAYLIALDGTLMVQQNINPRVIRERLYSLLPEELYYELKKREEEELDMKMKGETKDSPEDEEIDMSTVDQLCEGDIQVESSDEYYYIIRMTDDAFRTCDDRAIQRILRDVDNIDLGDMMKVISGESRRRIFNNMSKRLAVMIAEDMIFRGSISLETAGGAATKVFMVFLKLVETAEIYCEEQFILKEMATIFLKNHHPSIDSSNSERIDAENRLYGMWNEYLSHTHKKIDLPCMK